MKKRISAALALCLALGCWGCQKTPERNIVASKNDGTFAAALESTPQAPPAAGAESAVYRSGFENANGAIHYDLSLTAPDLPPALPVVRVRPMEITPELAERTARAIFGDAEIYAYTTEHTKAELEAAILAVKESIGDWDALVAMCGGDEAAANAYRAAQKTRISEMEAAYASALETVDRKPCDWQFHPGSYYSDVTRGQIADSGQQVLSAGVTVDGTPYVYTATNRESAGFREHSVAAGPSEDFMGTGAGTAADARTVEAKALQIANAMGLGDWRVADCESGLDGGSLTQLVLTREYEGLPVTDHEGPGEAGTAYGPAYAYENLRMDFDGEKLTSFLYQGALAETGVVNANVQTLPFADVLAAAKAQMQRSGTIDPVTGETAAAPEDGSFTKVAVDRVELGLSRVFIQDDAAEYYLVPTYTFYGTSTACDAGGTPIDNSFFDEAAGRTVTLPAATRVELAVINAVDGTVIDTGLGY